MRTAIERRLNRTWYGDQRPDPLLRGLAQVYRLGADLASRANHLRRARDLIGRPIIVVGNLTAGGSGKTPLVIRLCALATELGIRAGVVSRGYGRSTHEAMWVRADSNPDETGDEPVLIAVRSGLPVRVDRDREQAVRALFERGVELVIADDGLQRAQLPRALELCVVDAERGFGNGRLLPAGPLREPMSRLESVDYVVAQGETKTAHEFGSHAMTLEPGLFQRLDGAGHATATELETSGKPVHAFAGMGRPERFFETLRALGLDPVCHSYPDHHPFQAQDFAGVSDQALIVMTEKDAVKCRGLGLHDAWCLPVSARLDDELEQALRDDIKRLCAREAPS